MSNHYRINVHGWKQWHNHQSDKTQGDSSKIYLGGMEIKLFWVGCSKHWTFWAMIGRSIMSGGPPLPNNLYWYSPFLLKSTWSLMSVMLSWQVPLRAGQLVVPAVRCSWLPRAASSASVLLSDNLVFHETYMQHKYPNDYIITFINVMKCPNSWIAIWSI